jgi:sugar lactone lactonase YvrE
MPDGSLIVGSALDRTLLRVTPSGIEPLVHLRDLGRFPLNDLLVTPEGRIYVTDWGLDPASRGEPRPTTIVCVEQVDGGWDAWPVATDLLLPDGLVLAPDGSLMVAEGFARRITSFQVRSDGSLAAAKVWADVTPNIPSGLTFDRDGAAWVCDPVNDGVMRVQPGAGALDWISTDDHDAYGCCLGGPEGDVLFLCTSTTSDPARTVVERTGRIEALTVPVPAAGA